MTFVVTANCHKCKYTDCVTECPTEAFHEGPNMLYINPTECVDCGACVPACPVNAIYEESDLPEKFRHYIEMNANLSKDLPIIFEKKDPLPTAVTLSELEANPLINFQNEPSSL